MPKHLPRYWHCSHSITVTYPHIVAACSRVYVTVRCPSVCPSASQISTAAAACGGFAAVSPAGRRYRSIAARPVLSSNCEQCHVVSWRWKLNTDLLMALFGVKVAQRHASSSWSRLTTYRRIPLQVPGSKAIVSHGSNLDEIWTTYQAARAVVVPAPMAMIEHLSSSSISSWHRVWST